MHDLVQHTLPQNGPRFQPPKTLSETNERLLELRMTEMETREDIIDHLRQVHSRKLWRKAGFKSLADFCEKELNYSAPQVRELMIELGVILTPASMVANNPIVQKRIDQLRLWRRERAHANGVAAFRILTNRCLLAIAEIAPTSKDELLKIPGLGEKKLEEFGAEILGCLASAEHEAKETV